MSDDNKNSEPFDFNFDSLNEDSGVKTGDSSFDLDNPFGDDIVVTRGESTGDLPKSTGESSFDLGTYDSGVSVDNPYLDTLAADSSAEELSEDSSMESTADGEIPADTKKKKGFLGGLFGGKSKSKPKNVKTEKSKKEKVIKEKAPKAKKEKVEKKPKEPAGERVPRDWSSILCLVVAGFLALSLVLFNVAALMSGQAGTFVFLGVINVMGLAAISVPILFLRARKDEQTLPNVMLGISAVALFTGVMILLTEFYSYGFIVKP